MSTSSKGSNDQFLNSITSDLATMEGVLPTKGAAAIEKPEDNKVFKLIKKPAEAFLEHPSFQRKKKDGSIELNRSAVVRFIKGKYASSGIKIGDVARYLGCDPQPVSTAWNQADVKTVKASDKS